MAVYAALGLKLLSNKSGFVFERHESESRTPQEVMATQADVFRQAFATVA